MKTNTFRAIHYCLKCNCETENMIKQNKMSAFICEDCYDKDINLEDFNIVFKKKRRTK